MPQLSAGDTAEYKGRSYRVKWAGKTKFGERANLEFLDGSRNFWVPLSMVTASSSSAGKRSRREPRSYSCDECGDYVEAGSRCWETGLTH